MSRMILLETVSKRYFVSPVRVRFVFLDPFRCIPDRSEKSLSVNVVNTPLDHDFLLFRNWTSRDSDCVRERWPSNCSDGTVEKKAQQFTISRGLLFTFTRRFLSRNCLNKFSKFSHSFSISHVREKRKRSFLRKRRANPDKIKSPNSNEESSSSFN